MIRYAIFALRPAIDGDPLRSNESATFKPGKAQLAGLFRLVPVPVAGEDVSDDGEKVLPLAAAAELDGFGAGQMRVA